MTRLFALTTAALMGIIGVLVGLLLSVQRPAQVTASVPASVVRSDDVASASDVSLPLPA